MVKSDPSGPADTTMMGVVHDALRRDLNRVEVALTATPVPAGAQRQAIGEHILWMMTFLHHHHEGEDTGLYPLVRSRASQDLALLDEMQGQHDAIQPAIDAIEAAARGYRDTSGDAERTELLAALSSLSAVLLPHLQQEEDEAMPLVAATITDGEWREWDDKYNVKPKSAGQLGNEGHWLMDGLDDRRYDHLVHLVPAPVRFVLLKGFARRYRVAASRRWGSGVNVGPANRPVVTR